MITRRNALTLAALPFGLAASGIARAQSYPAKPIRFIVPFPAGGSTDVAARLIAECLTRAFAQQVYVENKSGANGTIGVEEAAKSGPAAPTCRFTCGRRSRRLSGLDESGLSYRVNLLRCQTGQAFPHHEALRIRTDIPRPRRRLETTHRLRDHLLRQPQHDLREVDRKRNGDEEHHIDRQRRA
jgi:hypothetical protein